MTLRFPDVWSEVMAASLDSWESEIRSKKSTNVGSLFEKEELLDQNYTEGGRGRKMEINFGTNFGPIFQTLCGQFLNWNLTANITMVRDVVMV